MNKRTAKQIWDLACSVSAIILLVSGIINGIRGDYSQGTYCLVMAIIAYYPTEKDS